MTLGEALEIPRGITAVIGGGGKSTLLLRLGQELAQDAKVLLCTSTHMFPPPGVPLAQSIEEARALLTGGNLVALGSLGPQGKLGPCASSQELLALGDYILCEADGSKGLPLKAHLPHEPVVPRETARLIYVLGLDGLGRPIAEAAHRPERYAALLGQGLAHRVTPADAVDLILKEGYGKENAILLLNKAEGERLAAAREAARLWPGRGVIASLQSPQAVREAYIHGNRCP